MGVNYAHSRQWWASPLRSPNQSEQIYCFLHRVQARVGSIAFSEASHEKCLQLYILSRPDFWYVSEQVREKTWIGRNNVLRKSSDYQALADQTISILIKAVCHLCQLCQLHLRIQR